jgi:1-aminocyclopropane-1-carboxylate deaminase/D-cysteine desulfhydrase-like pyridoxal-dependent ACC family enzyme
LSPSVQPSLQLLKGTMMKILSFFSLLLVPFIAYSAHVEEKSLLQALNIETRSNDPWIQELNTRGSLSQSADPTKVPPSSNALFRAYPALQKNLPYIALGSLPTPVEKLKNLGAKLSIANLYIKRDDLTGAKDDKSNHIYGGNKVRKLEFLYADALSHGAPAIITFGCAGSNHAVAAAVYAKRLGLDCICMLKPEANSNAVRTNLLIHKLIGTDLRYYPDNTTRKLGTISAWWDYKQAHGKAPYVIPTGGSAPLGAIGFVNAAFELKEQILSGKLPQPDKIYVPCGSMGTTTGLILGCKLAALKTKIVAVTTEPEEEKDEFKNGIINLFKITNALLHSLDSSIPLLELSENDFFVNRDFCGPEYAVFIKEGAEAKKELKATENIPLDGIYTAKAFAGLLDDIRKQNIKSNEVVLFWNTYCGLDFSKQLSPVKYSELGHCFHEYFEKDVQPLDIES